MPRRLPSLNGLKAFEAAARHQSFTRAAEELSVTQGAISHQVKALEAEIGLRLFHRERQRLLITEAGRSYLEVVRDALDRISAGTERLQQRERSGILTISMSPGFAAKWLVHRLGRFSEQHPDIELRISASIHHVDFAREDVDIAIRHSAAPDSGLDCARLCTEQRFPVCSPKLLTGRNAIRKPTDLVKHSLLHVNDHKDWASWLDAAHISSVDPTKGTVFNQASMAIDAAIEGQGVAVARSTLVAWDLIGSRLIRPFNFALPATSAYWIVCPKAKSQLPKNVTIRDWLLAEAAADQLALKKLDQALTV
jgi:LysR family transcriptional regulator, glycine cleavage system transcriptional activator